jgi:hypothetical protein
MKHYTVTGTNIICDKCSIIIATVYTQAQEEAASMRFQGMNNGEHECDNCRKSRERAYDGYVTTNRVIGHLLNQK